LRSGNDRVKDLPDRREVFVIRNAFALLLLSTAVAFAQPSPKDMEAAKKNFQEGKALYEKGKFEESVPKFLESYRLSKRPQLLYNVGLAYEDAKDPDLATLYYKKYLKEAPADDANRADAEARLAKLGGVATPPVDPKGPVTPDAPVEIKPAGTYTAKDFEHVTIMEAPPSKPLDITASLPNDSGWTATLFYRGAGDTKFFTKVMKPRYKELVARIPGQKVGGQSIQYYIEVKDQAGTQIARAGKSTSPNLIAIEQNASPRFYPDWSDEDGGSVATPTQITKIDTEEDPLNNKGQPKEEDPIIGPTVGPAGPTDEVATETSTMKYLKYGTTGGAVVFLGLSALFYVQAGNYAQALEDDINKCPAGTSAPCHPFDDYNKDLQDTGKSRALLSNITLAAGVVTAGVAGYLWYRGFKAKKSPSTTATNAATGPDEVSWMVAPSVGSGFAGASALITF